MSSIEKRSNDFRASSVPLDESDQRPADSHLFDPLEFTTRLYRCSSIKDNVANPHIYSDLAVSSLNENSLLHTTDSIIKKFSPTDSLLTDEDSGLGPTTHIYGDHRTGSVASLACSGSGGSNSSEANLSAASFHRDELLLAMTEDLTDWLIRLYPELEAELDVDSFFYRLSDGTILCQHVNELHRLLQETRGSASSPDQTTRLTDIKVGGRRIRLPDTPPTFQRTRLTGSNAISFVARNNVSNFIVWCRQLGMNDSVMFESEDLVCQKNVRNVAICLLELARLGGHVGLAVPQLVQLEVEIDQEMTALRCSDNNQSSSTSSSSLSSPCSSSAGYQSAVADSGKNAVVRKRRESSKSKPTTTHRREKTAEIKSPPMKPERQRPVVDMRSLDEIVRDLLSQCTCKQTFPMTRVGEGRYLFGDKSMQIFVRILRSHVMVRVGGGWDTLSHFLAKHDECRKTNSPTKVQLEKDSGIGVDSYDSQDPDQLVAALKQGDRDEPIAPINNASFLGQGRLNVVRKGVSVGSPTQPMSSTPMRSCKEQTPPPSQQRPKTTTTPTKVTSNHNNTRPRLAALHQMSLVDTDPTSDEDSSRLTEGNKAKSVSNLHQLHSQQSSSVFTRLYPGGVKQARKDLSSDPVKSSSVSSKFDVDSTTDKCSKVVNAHSNRSQRCRSTSIGGGVTAANTRPRSRPKLMSLTTTTIDHGHIVRQSRQRPSLVP